MLLAGLRYNIFQSDTDVVWQRNPYPVLKTLLSAHHLLLQVEVGHAVNGGVIYVQNAHPQGPVVRALEEMSRRVGERAGRCAPPSLAPAQSLLPHTVEPELFSPQTYTSVESTALCFAFFGGVRTVPLGPDRPPVPRTAPSSSCLYTRTSVTSFLPHNQRKDVRCCCRSYPNQFSAPPQTHGGSGIEIPSRSKGEMLFSI